MGSTNKVSEVLHTFIQHITLHSLQNSETDTRTGQASCANLYGSSSSHDKLQGIFSTGDAAASYHRNMDHSGCLEHHVKSHRFDHRARDSARSISQARFSSVYINRHAFQCVNQAYGISSSFFHC